MDTGSINREVGDPAWFYDGSSEMLEGTVIAKVNHNNQIIYVIEVDTPIDPVYYARTSLAVSDAKDKPVGFIQWINRPVNIKR